MVKEIKIVNKKNENLNMGLKKKKVNEWKKDV
jgi:hypothetical protein